MSASRSLRTTIPSRLTVLCLACSLALACGTVARADEPAGTTVDWKERAAAGLVPNGEVIELTEQRPFAAKHALTVVRRASKATEPTRNPVMPVTEIENPPITKQCFALNGWI